MPDCSLEPATSNCRCSLRAICCAILAFKACVLSYSRFLNFCNKIRAVALAAVCFTSPAFAEIGEGVRVGDFLLHPQLTLQLGYDDNVFFEDDSEEPASSALISMEAAIKAQNNNRERFSLSFSGNAGLKFFVFSDGASEQVMDGQNGLDHLNLAATADLLRRSVIGIQLSEKLGYVERPLNDSLASGFQRLNNVLGADVMFRPGRLNSEMLRVTAGYRLGTQYFLGGQKGSDRGEKIEHKLHLQARWKFFPKTALTFSLQHTRIDYAQPKQLASNKEMIKSADRDQTPLRVEIGLQGLLTSHVSLNLTGGYLNTFQNEGDSFSGFVGEASLAYKLEPSVFVKLGAALDAGDSSFSNYYRAKRFFGEADIHIHQAFILNLKGEYDDYVYSVAGSTDGLVYQINNGQSGRMKIGVEREDPIVRYEVNFRYCPREWFSVGLKWRLDLDWTDYESPPYEEDPLKRDKASYRRMLYSLEISGTY